jgi:hypothetical protein
VNQGMNINKQQFPSYLDVKTRAPEF